MQIKLQSLKLKNFKGIKQFTFQPEGADAEIRGQNGTGKSTVADALNWLLFDKNQAGEKSFSIKTLDGGNEAVHGLDHEVEATLLVDGRPLQLGKMMREKWTKKRGANAEAAFQGHETLYTLDGIPKKKSEYDSAVAAIAPEESFRLLTSTTYFNAIKWQDRRRILLEVTGKVSDAEVIAAHDGLEGIEAVLDGHSLDDRTKALKSRRPKINTALNEIQPRIDEALRAKPEEAELCPPKGKSYEALRKELQETQNRRAAMLAGDTTATGEEILRHREAMATLNRQHDEALRAWRAGEETKKEKARKATQEVEDNEHKVEREVSLIEDYTNNLEALREKWAERNATEWAETECPTCGQALPEEQAEEAQTRFNEKRAEELKAIEAEAKKQTAALQESIKRKEAAESRIDELIAAEDAQETHDPEPVAPDHSEREKAIATLTAGSTSAAPNTKPIDEEIERLETQIAAFERFSAALKQSADIDKRVGDLMAEKKELGIELDAIDQNIALLEEFLRCKVAMLTGTVNERFAPLSFRLFGEQVNGGLAETCETLVPSANGAMVPWSDVNTGARVRAGLQIIKVLSGHYGITAPVFVDNAESVTGSIDNGESQTIKLIATEEQKELKVTLLEQPLALAV
ncbi:MAG: hypothetical protein RI826_04205 [Chlorobium phaeovibrioides]|nr:hypothetical protein [Chlorobium phaeovibrioides]